ncbi:Sterile alpha motif domain-containing protein 5 [Dufourea novaeangliae]|uniref:Sterile alpha motif domain-containing protein 5 n=1 Tax=Dufourea novaeangliae TaxID=178035 RepID=A0A154PC35_DUFNO|nr:Sterile alpha motif domain-containing protein 5 [Dufourea novaeangliae]
MTMASNIVVEWLRSLHLGQYSESFIDNGYDDLEICKQIGDPDLDAIGVFNQTHRARLLQSVKTLREEGAASVYFTLEESNDCLCDNVSSKSSRTSSERPPSDKEAQRASPTASSSSGGQELTKFADEYEEGKAELVRIPRMQLRMLLQEKLRHDGIRLACQPYTTPNRGNTGVPRLTIRMPPQIGSSGYLRSSSLLRTGPLRYPHCALQEQEDRGREARKPGDAWSRRMNVRDKE